LLLQEHAPFVSSVCAYDGHKGKNDEGEYCFHDDMIQRALYLQFKGWLTTRKRFTVISGQW